MLGDLRTPIRAIISNSVRVRSPVSSKPEKPYHLNTPTKPMSAGVYLPTLFKFPHLFALVPGCTHYSNQQDPPALQHALPYPLGQGLSIVSISTLLSKSVHIPLLVTYHLSHSHFPLTPPFYLFGSSPCPPVQLPTHRLLRRHDTKKC